MQAVSIDMETKIAHREREIDSLSVKSTEKAQAKRDLYLQSLEALATKDKGFSSVLLKIRNGISSAMKEPMSLDSPGNTPP